MSPLSIKHALWLTDSRKWVYKYKYTRNNVPSKYKARIVANGFKQKQGIDFDEIFSPIVKMTTLEMMLAPTPK